MRKGSNFKAAVKSAAAEALTSRRELGCNYAAEFLKDPDGFDPRKLTRLGRAGLGSFVATVGAPTVKLAPSPSRTSRCSVSGNKPSGWEDQRTVPIPFEILGLLVGTFVGTAIIFAIALVVSL